MSDRPSAPIVSTLLRVAVCAVAAWMLWRGMGAVGLALSAPLWGVLLARPMFDLVAEAQRRAKAAAYAGLEGRHYEHRGTRIDISEDDRHRRWLSVADVRKVIPGLPRSAVLQRQFPDGVVDDPALKGARIRAEALLAYLAKSTDSGSIALRNWVEREVARPAALLRQRRGLGDRPGDDEPPTP